MNTRKINKWQFLGRYLLCAVLFVNTSCVDHFFPEALDAYDPEAVFTQTVYEPQLGRTTLMTNNFNPGNSTLPLTFEITDIKRADGSPAPELTQHFPVKVWKAPYLANEKSLEEIEAKRGIEYRSLFQVKKHSGEFIMWEKALSSFIRCAPDAGYVFNVLTRNSGGYAYTTEMQLKPQREVDYQPSNYDPELGIDTCPYVHPLLMENLAFDSTGYRMMLDDIQIYFRENKDLEKIDGGYTLTFRFFNPDYTPIDPARFNQTDWNKLVHGFDMEKTDTYVRYRVAYPIPLVEMISDYNNQKGDLASIKFAYNRINSLGEREDSFMDFEFAIYREAHWEIWVVFAAGKPLFEDRKY